MKYSKPAHGEGCTEDNEEGLGSFVLALALAVWAAEKKALPKGLRWPRAKTGRRPIYAQGISRLSRLPGVLNGANANFYISWIGDSD
jgi:hypothetical protein